ncbi:MAG TPA: outer membrane protein assembly factor BamA [Bacteroidales bacterium]|nr:outer membrane protein assembly factor BamA [Bacteroidales bacterium]
MRQIIFSVLLIIAGIRVFAQDIDFSGLQYVDYSKQKEYIIADIKITGVKYLQPQVLVSLSGLRVGDKITIPGDDITKAIEKYWKHGLFSDVKILIDKIEDDQVYLQFYLLERPRLSSVRFHGIRNSETTDLNEKIELKAGSQVTDNVINNVKTILTRHYVSKGFYNADVKIVPDEDTASFNKVILDIFINKDEKVKIGDIILEGNEVFSDARLRRLMKKTKKKNLNFFKTSKYIEADFREDKEKLLSFYNENGFRDAQILNTELKPINDKRLALLISLEEGKKYFVRDVSWLGNTQYPTEILNHLLGFKKGDVYDQSLLEKRLHTDQDAITTLYMDNGYLFFSVDPVEVNIEEDSVDLEMRIYEGKQATINEVVIKGNTKTNEHVVRRELRTRPGELFSKSDIIRSVRELATLGHFDPEKISPNPIPDPANGTVDLEYQLEERANDQLEVSGGWGGFGFVGTVGVRFSNFSARNILNKEAWRPVPTGDGQTLSIRAQSNGRYYQGYNLSFVEPWFGGKKPNNFSVSLFHTAMRPYQYYSVEDVNGHFKIYGASVGLGHRLKWPDDYFTIYNEIGFQRYSLNNWTTDFFLCNGVANTISFKTAISRSSQDQMIYPRQGSMFTLSLQLTPPYSLFRKDKFWELSEDERAVIDQEVRALPASETASESAIANEVYKRITGEETKRKFNLIEYHKWSFKSAWYTALIGDLVLATKAEFGLLGFYDRAIRHAPFEKFDVGGSGMNYSNYYYGNDIIALRGYEEGSLTPSSLILNSEGEWKHIDNGNIYNKFTVELRYPFTTSESATIYGLLFLEGGNAWSDFKEFNPFIIKRSAGIGLRAFLPMFGLLGVDWGYGFDQQPGEDKLHHGSQFHFMMGQQF